MLPFVKASSSMSSLPCSRLSNHTLLRPIATFQRSRHRPLIRFSNEEAIANMQSYKAGLAKALNSREDSLRSEVAAKAAAVEGGSNAPSATALRELNKDDFWTFLKEADGEGKLVVVDFYTDWCGPCKLMVPLLADFNQELGDKAEVVKFNCNKDNKELGVSLGIKVAPTFHLYRGKTQVAMMTGAKMDELKKLVQEHI